MKQILIKSILVLLFVVGIVFSSDIAAYGQFVEDYGNIGTLKNFKGQVMDAGDGLIPFAEIELINLDSKKEYSVKADENGIFFGNNLPLGKYKIRIVLSGFNQTEFTVKLRPGSISASSKFIIVRLSPGCASGGDVVLGKSLINIPPQDIENDR